MVNAMIESGSKVFPKDYLELSEKEQIKILSKVKGVVDLSSIKDEDTLKALNTMNALKTIQELNGLRLWRSYTQIQITLPI